MTRSESKQAMLSELGATPVVADALRPDQVGEAVARATPDVIVHQLTAIGALVRQARTSVAKECRRPGLVRTLRGH